MSFLRSTICVSGQALYSQSAQVESLFYFQTSLVRGSFRYGRNVHPVVANSLGARSKQIQKVSMSSSTAVLDTNSNGIFNQMLSKFANSKSVSFSHSKDLRKFNLIHNVSEIKSQQHIVIRECCRQDKLLRVLR